MMFQNNVVCAVKVGGKILRESSGTVSLPFGCEYSILIKNLNSVRIQTCVSVDGVDVTDGRLIIGPNSSMELERFIRYGNLQYGNRFKFIERTAEIEAHRGIGSDDGLIRVEAWKEVISIPHYQPQCWTEMRSLQFSSSDVPTAGSPAYAAATSDIGITVAGSVSNQQFYHVPSFALEPQSVVLVLRLRGDVQGNPISAPVTVDAKPTCSTCGKTNKADSQFCVKCGTSLVLV